MTTMGCSTAETEWPSSKSISEEKKRLLSYYFNLLDTNEATSGGKIAKLFTDDGCIISPAGTFEGSEQIQISRQQAWNVVKARSHSVTRVYVFDHDATDLLVIGTVVQGLANGKLVPGEWAARICLEQGPADDFKIKSHQVWADFGGAQKAIQEALSSSKVFLEKERPRH